MSSLLQDADETGDTTDGVADGGDGRSNDRLLSVAEIQHALGELRARRPKAEGRRTIAQWNTASFGTDYRIGPRETKIETYTWTLPDDIEPGKVIVKGTLNYRRLVKSVAEYLKVPEDETEIVHVNDAETWFEVFD